MPTFPPGYSEADRGRRLIRVSVAVCFLRNPGRAGALSHTEKKEKAPDGCYLLQAFGYRLLWVGGGRGRTWNARVCGVCPGGFWRFRLGERRYDTEAILFNLRSSPVQQWACGMNVIFLHTNTKVRSQCLRDIAVYVATRPRTLPPLSNLYTFRPKHSLTPLINYPSKSPPSS